jgi:hypothetical protein
MVSEKRMAEAALEAGWVSLEQLQMAVPEARRTNKPFALLLRELGLDEEQITFLQACALDIPYARVDRLQVSAAARRALPLELQKRYRAAALRVNSSAQGSTVFVAMLPEAASELAAHLTELTGKVILPVGASSHAIKVLLDRVAAGEADDPYAPSAEHYDFDSPAQPRTRGVPMLVMPAVPERHAAGALTSLADF